jgi:hypothetical protein
MKLRCSVHAVCKRTANPEKCESHTLGEGKFTTHDRVPAKMGSLPDVLIKKNALVFKNLLESQKVRLHI